MNKIILVSVIIGLALGITSVLAYQWYTYKPIQAAELSEEQVWCKNNQAECKWAQNRQIKFYDAAKKLYFQEEK